LRIGQDQERIVKGGGPRRIAPAEEVLALKPELAPPRQISLSPNIDRFRLLADGAGRRGDF